MKTIQFSIILCLLSIISHSSIAQMNNETMAKIIETEVEAFEGRLGNWQVLYGERLLYVITDESANRMRIFTPIVAEEELKEGQLKKMLEANFHSALDAKYSLYEGLVLAVYTHPLKELQKEQFIDAMNQVATLVATFGGSYSSTDVIFNPGSSEEEESEPEEKKREERTNKKPSGKKKDKT